MGRRKAELAEPRDAAVNYLQEQADEGRRLSAQDWEHAMAMSSYSKRHLSRLLNERRSGTPVESSTWHIDDDVITAVFLTTGNIASAYRMLKREGRTGLPSLRHFRRVVTCEMGTHMLAYAEGGASKARDFKVYLSTAQVCRNHTWELDHTELPILVVPRGYKTAIRPWLTAVMDRATRYPLSWVVTFGRPSEQEVRACLVQAMTMRAAPDGLTPVGGTPMRAVWDRGLEFLAKNITESCMRLGVLPVALPAYSPQLKPHLERFWGFLKRDALAVLPGYTDNVSDIRGHNAIADACLGQDEFMLKLADWFDRYITEHEHSSLGCTPLEAWKRDTTPLVELPVQRLWQDFLTAKNKVIVSKNGIRFDTIDFTAPELIGKVGRSLEIRYLPHDRSFIEVFDGGVHVATAIPRHALTADLEQEILDHRRSQTQKAQARFTASNRIRREGYESTTGLTRNKKGQLVVNEPTIDELDLLIDGEEALAALIGPDNANGQGALF